MVRGFLGRNWELVKFNPTHKLKVNRMSDEGKVAPDGKTELQSLKAKADVMGIKYHPATGLKKLRDLVNAKLDPDSVPDKPSKSKAKKEEVVVKKELTQAERAARNRQTANALVRVKIMCMNPNKKNWPGQFISVANKSIGTIRKFIPFNADDGYHIPQVLLTELQDKKCQIFVNKKTRNGVTMRKGKLIPEFSIQILEPLTAKEMKDLATKQAVRGSIDNDDE